MAKAYDNKTIQNIVKGLINFDRHQKEIQKHVDDNRWLEAEQITNGLLTHIETIFDGVAALAFTHYDRLSALTGLDSGYGPFAGFRRSKLFLTLINSLCHAILIRKYRDNFLILGSDFVKLLQMSENNKKLVNLTKPSDRNEAATLKLLMDLAGRMDDVLRGGFRVYHEIYCWKMNLKKKYSNFRVISNTTKPPKPFKEVLEFYGEEIFSP
jgi:hypothetical protein